MRLAATRIGWEAGFAGDRFDPASDLLDRGRLDYLVLECLAERTITAGTLRRPADPGSRYDPLLERRLTRLVHEISDLLAGAAVLSATTAYLPAWFAHGPARAAGATVDT